MTRNDTGAHPAGNRMLMRISWLWMQLRGSGLVLNCASLWVDHSGGGVGRTFNQAPSSVPKISFTCACGKLFDGRVSKRSSDSFWSVVNHLPTTYLMVYQYLVHHMR